MSQLLDEPTDGPAWQICQQIVEDPVSGLVFQFEVTPDGISHFRVYGDMPFGNRDFVFSSGKLLSAGSFVQCRTKPAWTTWVDL